MNDNVRRKMDKDFAAVGEVLGTFAEAIFGEESPTETIARRTAERIATHGHETSPAVKRAVERVGKAIAEEKAAEEKPRERPRLAREPAEPDPKCPGCRVARKQGGRACVEHS